MPLHMFGNPVGKYCRMALAFLGSSVKRKEIEKNVLNVVCSKKQISPDDFFPKGAKGVRCAKILPPLLEGSSVFVALYHKHRLFHVKKHFDTWYEYFCP